MKLSYKSLPFAAKAEGDGSTFEGYAAVFCNLDGWGDIIAPGAFGDGLAEFLDSGLVCFNHGQVIGKPLEAREDAKGLFVKGRISDTTTGRDVKTLLKDGVVTKMSIGYRTIQSRMLTAVEVQRYWADAGYAPTAEDNAILAQAGGYGIRLITKLKLYEFSPVGVPANGQADITSVKSMPRLSQVKAFARRARQEAKAGRVLSSSNRTRLTSMSTALRSAADDLDALLDETDPTTKTPPPPGGPDNDEAKSLAGRAEAARTKLRLFSPYR